MNTLAIEMKASIQDVELTEDSLVVDLADGRTVSVPIAWYPRLMHGTREERSHWRIIGKGEGIHWPDVDEDISVENILLGRPSGESQRSFKKWLEGRMEKRKKPTMGNRGKVRP
jgi:hypothetical protein